MLSFHWNQFRWRFIQFYSNLNNILFMGCHIKNAGFSRWIRYLNITVRQSRRGSEIPGIIIWQALLRSLLTALWKQLGEIPCSCHRPFMNILVRWNRTSGNLEIRVPVLGNRLFCPWWLIHFCLDIGQNLAASAVRSSLYQCLNRNYDSVCTKTDLKSDFHITGQLM